MSGERLSARVLSTQIDVANWEEVTNRLLAWGHARERRYVAICNVHVVVTAARDALYGRIISDADMATPDGAPIAWMLRRLGHTDQKRINGPNLMWTLCSRASSENLPVYFYGSTRETLTALDVRLRKNFPGINIAGMESPSFRLQSVSDDAATVDRINKSNAGLVFVALGCPKQEKWMFEHRGRINAVMIGVGAAFDFHAGTLRRAPLWMQDAGIEWLHRLASEPRRLWRRYLVTNSLFVLGAARQLLFGR